MHRLNASKKKMKKRIIALTMLLAVCFTLFACGNKQSGREAVERQAILDVRTYLSALCSQSNELSKVGTVDVTYIGEDTNSSLSFTPSADASPEDKKKMEETTITKYNISGTCSALDKYGKEYKGTFDGEYILFEYKGDFLVEKQSLTVN